MQEHAPAPPPCINYLNTAMYTCIKYFNTAMYTCIKYFNTAMYACINYFNIAMYACINYFNAAMYACINYFNTAIYTSKYLIQYSVNEQQIYINFNTVLQKLQSVNNFHTAAWLSYYTY